MASSIKLYLKTEYGGGKDMTDWYFEANVLFLMVIAIFWWYAPICASNYCRSKARVEMDLTKRKDLLDWAIFYNCDPRIQLELSRTIFEAARIEDDPHERLRQSVIAEEIINDLMRRKAVPDDCVGEASHLLDEIKRYEVVARVISNASAENKRKCFKVM